MVAAARNQFFALASKATRGFAFIKKDGASCIYKNICAWHMYFILHHRVYESIRGVLLIISANVEHNICADGESPTKYFAFKENEAKIFAERKRVTSITNPF